jgi:cytochrome c551/c552
MQSPDYKKLASKYSPNSEYSINFTKFQNQEIADGEWQAYCDMLFTRLLDENVDVLIRLRDQ